MTLHRRSAISCDYVDCPDVVVDDGTQARLEGKRLGWAVARRIGGHTVDLCPTHKPGARQRGHST